MENLDRVRAHIAELTNKGTYCFSLKLLVILILLTQPPIMAKKDEFSIRNLYNRMVLIQLDYFCPNDLVKQILNFI